MITHTAFQNETVTHQLVSIARTHIRLALEHSQPNTTPVRRQAIRSEILELRQERDTLLEMEGYPA